MQKNIAITIFTIVILLSSVVIFPVSPAYAAAPGAPTNGSPSGTPAETSLTITWTAPTSDGGSAITGYKIESAAETGFGQFAALQTRLQILETLPPQKLFLD